MSSIRHFSFHTGLHMAVSAVILFGAPLVYVTTAQAAPPAVGAGANADRSLMRPAIVDGLGGRDGARDVAGQPSGDEAFAAASDELWAWTDARRVEAFEAEVAYANSPEVAGVHAFDDWRGTVLRVQSDVLFPQLTSGVAAHAAPTVDVLAKVLRMLPGRAIRLEVHTDSVGVVEVNQTLTAVRGEALRRALSARGIPAWRVEIDARGESQPAASNETIDGRWENRRIDVIVTRPEARPQG